MKTKKNARAPKSISAEELQRMQEEETLEFLAYLEQDFTVVKEEPDPRKKASRKTLICDLNLEESMPTVEEAIRRMILGFQEMRVSGVKLVRLIHGYGSTGRGGKIRVGVRKELEAMTASRRIRGFVTGGKLSPYSAESRNLADRFPEVVHDRDYGKCNQGITIVIL